MPLQNFIDNQLPTVKAAWLNAVDVFYNTAISSAGASVVGFIQAGAGAVATTLQIKIRRESYSVFDAGAKGDNVADDTAAQNTAVTYVESTYDPATYASASPANGPCKLLYPSGYYKTNGTITVTKKVAFTGEGPAEFSSGSRVVQFTPASDLFQINPIAQGMSVSFENMSLIASGGGAGNLINVTRTTATCNSQRYSNLVWGTPPALALRIQAGDDIIIDKCLVDVAALSALSFGTATASDAVTNVRINVPAFFAVNGKCILLYNIDDMQITSPQVYPSGAGRTNYFIDGYNTLPYQIKNVSVIGGNFKNVDCLVKATAVNGLKLNGVSGTGLGAGAGATLSCIELTGTCTGFSLNGATLSGNFDTKNFYNDAGGTVGQANISGNIFINNGGTGQALVCGNTSGVIDNNYFVGFTVPSVSELVTTTGSAVNPGVIAAGGTFTYTATVTGAKQGDHVTVDTVNLTWPAPTGIEIIAFISAANTVSIAYRNVTAGAIGVPAHDIRYKVSRLG